MPEDRDALESWQEVRGLCTGPIFWHDEASWKALTERLAAILPPTTSAGDGELVERKADLVHFTKLIFKLDATVSNIVTGLEDEGDRIYLGSTNDADQLRELSSELEDAFYSTELTKYGDGRDVWAEMRALREARDASLARVKELEEALTDIRSHAQYRIQDGIEMGSTVWRLALEDIVGDADAALNVCERGVSASPTPRGAGD